MKCRSLFLISIFLLAMVIIINRISLNVSSEVQVRASYEKQSCPNEISNVGFMKTHKTASSTVQNILMRFGMNSNLNFVMLSEGTHLGPPEVFPYMVKRCALAIHDRH